MPFHNLRLNDLQQVIDHCGKNYPTLKKIRVLFNQLYSYAMKHEIISKDYSAYVNISKYKDRNPNKNIRSCFSTSEIALSCGNTKMIPIARQSSCYYTMVSVSQSFWI